MHAKIKGGGGGEGVLVASYPDPVQLSVTYCKQQEAGRGLGIRLGFWGFVTQMDHMVRNTRPSHFMLRVSCLKLEIKEVRCYEAQIEESEKGRQPPGVEPRTPLA